MNGDRGHLHVIVCPRRAGEIAYVFAERRQAGDDFVIFGNLILDAVIARSGLPKQIA